MVMMKMYKYNFPKSITHISHSTEEVKKIDKTTYSHKNNKYPSMTKELCVSRDGNEGEGIEVQDPLNRLSWFTESIFK